jgi:hypothetical protein
MTSWKLAVTPFILAFGLVIGVTDAEAQQRDRRGDRDRVEDRRDDRADDRWGIGDRRDDRRGNGAGKVPPGWCRGVGNPHNTPENCGYGRERDRFPYFGSRQEYDRAHLSFHRQLDDRFSGLANRRPYDSSYQLQLRDRKRSEHQDWHSQTGTRH